MSSGALTVHGSLSPMNETLKRIAAIGRTPSAVLQAVGHIVLTSTRHRIEQQVTPQGTPFAPLNKLYAIDKQGPGILRGPDFQVGLYGSLVVQAEGNVLRWGSNKVYAPVHQFGATIRPKNGRALSFEMGGRHFLRQSVTIPARPFLGLTTEDRDDIMEELEGFLRRAMRKP